jgi:hypothetical protein
MSFPLSSPSGREEYKEEYFIIKLAMPPRETRERTNPNLNKIRSGVFVNVKL